MERHARLVKFSVAALVFGVAYAITALLKSTTLYSDSYMVLYAGRFIAEHGFPGTDPFTVAGAGRQWINQQWLAHVIMYGSWKVGGYPFLAVVSAAATASGFALLALLAQARGAAAFHALTWSVVAFALAAPGTIIRAQAFAYPLFAVVLWLIMRDHDGGARFRPATALALVVLVAWGNLHGSVLMGAGLVAAYGLLRAVTPAAARDARSRVAYAATGIGAALAPLVTPYGSDIVDYYVSIMGNPHFATYITEWHPMSVGDPLSVLPAVLIAGMLVVLGFSLGRGYRPPLPLLVILLVLALLTVTSLRYGVWLGMVAALLVADIATALQHRSHASEAGATAAPLVRAARLRWMLGGVVTAVATLALFVAGESRYHSVVSTEAMERAARHAGDQPEATIVADESTSAALLWLHPDLHGRVAFDARLELFEPQELQSWFEFTLGIEPGFAEQLQRHDVVVLSRGVPGAAEARRLEVIDALADYDGTRTIGRFDDGIVVLASDVATDGGERS